MINIEVSHDDSREYLNQIIGPYNNLESELNKVNTWINYFVSDIQLENLAKVHRDKCVDIHYMFEKVYYNGDNSLKNEMFLILANKMHESGVLLINLFSIITSAIDDNKKVKKLKKKEKKKLIEYINQYNEICNFVNDYELKDNLKEILINRYNRLNIKEVLPGSFIKLYDIDKLSITELGLYDNYYEFEKEIIELITTKEKECDLYWIDIYKKKIEFINNALNNKTK